MKIRTGFVTNSSSYSSAEIKIDNPVLLEILKKYKEMGAFKFDRGIDNMIGKSIHYKAEDVFGAEEIPDSLYNVIDYLMDLIFVGYDYMKKQDKKLLNEFEAEIKNQKIEINKNFKSVLLKYNEESTDSNEKLKIKYEYKNGKGEYTENGRSRNDTSLDTPPDFM